VHWLSSSCERANFISTRRKQDGYQQQTREPAAMQQHQSHDLAECQREGKDQSGAWRNGTSFGLNDLEALVTVAREAKEWISAHALKG
jgi:hypothetical protein